MAKILLVDDDATVRKAYRAVLARAGHDVTVAEDGAQALAGLDARSTDVVVSDIDMPGMDGLSLLRAVRARDLELPVILVTGGPRVDSAVTAVEYGAFRYLLKPVAPALLEEVVARAAHMRELGRLKRQALELSAPELRVGERAALEVRFEAALASLWMAFQPIVSWRGRAVSGYEALVRNREPTLGRPDHLIEAAERLGRVAELGRAIRLQVAEAIPDAPAGARVFVNLHSRDLTDDSMYDPRAALSAHAGRVVLEITERASLSEVHGVVERVAGLRSLGYRIAIDDLGAGYAGLSSFALLEPDVVKLDMSLVRDIDSRATKRTIVEGLLRVCSQLELEVVCEGIETAAEREVLTGLGAELMQGYLFARPGQGFAAWTGGGNS